MGDLSTPDSVQKLQTALHAKAKAEPGYRFYALYDKISREDILAHAYAQCRSNKGAPGVDRQDFEAVEAYGVERWLGELALALRQEASRDGKYTYVEYARFADDLVILIDAYKRHDWLMAAVEKRLREELAELQVEINEEKSRIVDLGRGESFGFLGFDFRQVRSLRGAWRAHYTPKLKKRTALLRKLKDMFGRNQSQPVGRVVKLINPVLRGWVNYFAVGHSSECFSFVKDWVEKKIKRHMQRARNRQGFGWTRWSREWTYNTLGLFKGYRVVRPALKAVPAG